MFKDCKILVIDDSAFFREQVVDLLTKLLNCDSILEAANGVEAWGIIEKEPLDCVVCDWEMPEMKGDELLTEIRSHEKFKDLPFVMVTSKSDKESVIHAMKVGVTDYITKPFKTREAISKIRKAILSSEKYSENHFNMVNESSINLLKGGVSTACGEILSISNNDLIGRMQISWAVNICDDIDLEVRFKAPSGYTLHSKVGARVTRIEEEENSISVRKALYAFKFTKLNSIQETFLQEVMEKLKSDMPELLIDDTLSENE